MIAHYVKGTYNVRCLECGLAKVPDDVDKVGGWPKICFKVLVKDWVNEKGEFIPEPQQYERWFDLLIDPNSEDSIQDAMVRLREAGWTGTKFETIHQDMPGVEFAADCWHSQIKKSKKPEEIGKMRENWAIWTPNRKGKSEPLDNDPNVAKAMNALAGKFLKTAAKKPDTPPAAPPAPRGDDEGPPDDEVPF